MLPTNGPHFHPSNLHPQAAASMASPTHPSSVPHSPFFGYTLASHPLQAGAQGQSQPQSPTQGHSAQNLQHLQPNLFTVLFPGHSSGPSSISSSGESSVASMSPNLRQSQLSPFSSSMDRGRARTRAAGGDSPDGWEDNEGRGGIQQGDGGRYSEEEEDEFSSTLADAILKRPESIRVRSRNGRELDKGQSGSDIIKSKSDSRGEGNVQEGEEREEEEEVETVFTFPSISNHFTAAGLGENLSRVQKGSEMSTADGSEADTADANADGDSDVPGEMLVDVSDEFQQGSAAKSDKDDPVPLTALKEEIPGG